MNHLNTLLVSYPKTSYLILGMISGLAFAPIYCTPTLAAISIICYKTRNTNSKQATFCGFIFGFGHFLTSMYWVSLAITVYIEDFWWFIPIALIGLPIILGCFIALSCFCSSFFNSNKNYHIIFCLFWLFFEWVRSWIFTGLPWNLLGYALSFSDTLIQPANMIGAYGLSFIVIYCSTIFYYYFINDLKRFKIAILSCVIIFTILISYGVYRLNTNPSSFSSVKVRLVQPSIPQVSKWDANMFWHNLHQQLSLSQATGSPDLTIWSEAALVVPYNIPAIKEKLIHMLATTNSILITGSVTESKDDKIYSSMTAIAPNGNPLFEYHKEHLVPFGEYIPLRNILSLKKLTHGMQDYTPGNSSIVYLEKLNLHIRPLLCYESIFPAEVRISNKIVDLIINATNDAWYGKSSGPYQHFEISRMRAVENGLPLIRVANNGISAVIDPVGRVLHKLQLNEINFFDNFIPLKLNSETIYSLFGDITMLGAVFFVLLIIYLVQFFFTKPRRV